MEHLIRPPLMLCGPGFKPEIDFYLCFYHRLRAWGQGFSDQSRHIQLCYFYFFLLISALVVKLLSQPTFISFLTFSSTSAATDFFSSLTGSFDILHQRMTFFYSFVHADARVIGALGGFIAPVNASLGLCGIRTYALVLTSFLRHVQAFCGILFEGLSGRTACGVSLLASN